MLIFDDNELYSSYIKLHNMQTSPDRRANNALSA